MVNGFIRYAKASDEHYCFQCCKWRTLSLFHAFTPNGNIKTDVLLVRSYG
jgi:hypothetical protein